MHFVVVYDCSPITVYFDGKSLRYGRDLVIEDDEGFTLNDTKLYTIRGEPLSRSNLLSCITEPISLVRFMNNKKNPERGYKTSDKDGTHRFDDAQKIIWYKNKLVVKIAIVDYDSCVNTRGFVRGSICKSIICVYTYILEDGKVINKTLHYEVGYCVADCNFFYADEIKENPLTKELVEVIKLIQPKSRFAETRFAIQFWSNCVLKNAQEIFGDKKLERFSGALRKKSAAVSNRRMIDLLNSSGNLAVHVL